MDQSGALYCERGGGGGGGHSATWGIGYCDMVPITSLFYVYMKW